MDDGKNNLYRKTNFTKSGKYLKTSKRSDYDYLLEQGFGYIFRIYVFLPAPAKEKQGSKALFL